MRLCGARVTTHLFRPLPSAPRMTPLLVEGGGGRRRPPQPGTTHQVAGNICPQQVRLGLLRGPPAVLLPVGDTLTSAGGRRS